jgi:hypothetical protein
MLRIADAVPPRSELKIFRLPGKGGYSTRPLGTTNSLIIWVERCLPSVTMPDPVRYRNAPVPDREDEYRNADAGGIGLDAQLWYFAAAKPHIVEGIVLEEAQTFFCRRLSGFNSFQLSQSFVVFLLSV